MSSAGIVALVPICNDSVISPNFNALSGLLLDESILIYLSIGGSVIPMSVLESDSIESVKLRIQTCKGFVVKNQKLVCGGRELARSNSLLRDYGVAEGNVLHLVLRLSDLQVIKVRTSCGKEFTFHVERGRDVRYVKRKIAKKRKEFVDLEEQEVVCNGEKLEDQRLIDDICKYSDAVVHLLVRKSAKVRARPVDNNFELSIVASDKGSYGDDGESDKMQNGVSEVDGKVVLQKPSERGPLEPVIVNPEIKLPLAIQEMVDATLEGLSGGNDPVRSLEGIGGAYFMLDSSGKKYISVFKPMDEEPMAVNNPRGLPVSLDGEGLKKGTRVGEGALREVAAYLLDHPKSGRRAFIGDEEGFAGVPPTFLVKCLHKGFNHPGDLTAKLGSLQKFMENNGSCEDMGPGAFPVKEVHKISVLDIRLANADRHAGNILLSKGKDEQTVLIPIDHGYCWPESFEECTFDWLYWPQAREPYSDEIVDYVKLLDAEEDIALLKFHGWELPLEFARTLRISTMLLKKGVEKGLTPFEIGSIMCRETLKKESIMEEIVQEAQDSVLPGTSEVAFLETVSQIMDRRIHEVAKSRS
ncbi:putative phosphatidylinositol 4-kinase type 2-beta [Morus notabilis]|uniref:1-phosphatidylinositol 4-kinase n=1 Tax=Morus notabilis TaxID=981085 RepID=W9QZR7_9ROSA|nr:phosphatidylinositol 4-kinase gamma 4 [Morus notabilis]EXB62172.1 putative phosphatidylinositol 4-kinase type 2-beta [Morus notabilis]